MLFRVEACSYLQILEKLVAHIPSELVKTDGNLSTEEACLLEWLILIQTHAFTMVLQQH